MNSPASYNILVINTRDVLQLSDLPGPSHHIDSQEMWQIQWLDWIKPLQILHRNN